MDVDLYEEVVTFLQSDPNEKQWPKRVLESHHKSNFRRLASTFCLKDGTLHYRHKKHGLVRVVKPDEVQIILRACHSDPLSGHQGINRTWEKVKSRYHWPSMMKAVEEYISHCDQCQRQNHLAKTPSTLNPIPVKNKAFHMLGMDLVGPLRTTHNGIKYIVVLTDYLTKWPEVKAIPSKDASHICEFIIETVCRHGTPATILTDNGREFCNAMNDKLCKSLGIDHRMTTPYHPQTNGLTERYNQTMCNALAKYVGESQDDWDMYINQIAFATRTCQQKSTKATPFFLTYGREAVLPVELDIPTTVDDRDLNDNDDFQELLNDRATSFATLMRSQQDAVEEIGKAQLTQKKYYDAKHSHQDLSVGDQVLVKNSRRINRKGDKIMSKWVGPYTIAECVGKGVYTLKERKKKMNRKSLKKYNIPTAVPSTQASINPNQPPTIPRQTQKLPSRQTQRMPSRQTQRVPSRQTQRMPSRQTQRLPSRQTQRMPSRQTQRMPSRQTQRMPSRQTQRMPSRQTQRLPSRQTQRMPSRQTQRMPSRQTQRMPSRQTQRMPSRQTQRLPSIQTQRLPSRQTQTLPSRQTPRPKVSQPLSQPKRSSPNQPSRQPSTITDYFNAIDDDNKKILIEKCVEMNIPKPRCQNSLVYLSRDSSTLSFIRECLLNYEADLAECCNLYTIWYMTSKTETQQVKCEYTLQLAASVLTCAFHERTDLKTVLETVKPIPFSTTAPQPTPIPSNNVHVGNVSLSPNDLRTLRPMAWLNDQVVHAYLGLLSKECNDRNLHSCHILPSFLALKWETQNYKSWLYPKVPLESFHHVLLPICHQHHWILLVASMLPGEVTMLDSVPSESRARKFFDHWMNFMNARLSISEHKKPIKWTRGQTQSSVQEDGSSCGVFVLMNAEAVTKNVPPRLMRQCHVHTYRQHALHRLLSASTTPEEKMRRCDLPFCSNPVKSKKKHQMTQCPSYEKWTHKVCLGLDEDQVVRTCIFCC